MVRSPYEVDCPQGPDTGQGLVPSGAANRGAGIGHSHLEEGRNYSLREGIVCMGREVVQRRSLMAHREIPRRPIRRPLAG